MAIYAPVQQGAVGVAKVIQNTVSRFELAVLKKKKKTQNPPKILELCDFVCSAGMLLKNLDFEAATI